MEKQVILTVLGKVHKRTMSKLLKPTVEIKDNSWFFLDYSNDEVEVGKKFDTLLEGTNRTLIPGSSNIRLKRVFDQMGNNLDYIPRGFQTIAQLEFSPEVPSPIKNLKSYETWDYNPNSISITSHELIQLGNQPDAIIKTAYGFMLIQFKNFSDRRSTVSRKEFASFLIDNYGLKARDIQRLINYLKLSGMISERRNEQLELTVEEPVLSNS